MNDIDKKEDTVSRDYENDSLFWIKSVYHEKDIHGTFVGTYIYFLEIDSSDHTETRRVVQYPNGEIKAAVGDMSYKGEELAHGKVYYDSLEELQGEDIETIFISKEDFEKELANAMNQPGFVWEKYIV